MQITYDREERGEKLNGSSARQERGVLAPTLTPDIKTESIGQQHHPIGGDLYAVLQLSCSGSTMTG